VSPEPLVRRIIGAHGQLRRETYRKYAEELIRFATVVVGPHDAADAMSAGVVRALQAQAWPTVSNQRAYLYRAVLNEALMMRRRDATRRRYEARASEPDHETEPPVPRPEVLGALRRLSTRQRAVVYLTYWDDLDTGAIARLLGISDGAVRRHLARARSRLRKELDD
jgi:RNA polymerase sigma factor (sigma-70 family)